MAEVKIESENEILKRISAVDDPTIRAALRSVYFWRVANEPRAPAPPQESTVRPPGTRQPFPR